MEKRSTIVVASNRAARPINRPHVDIRVDNIVAYGILRRQPRKQANMNKVSAKYMIVCSLMKENISAIMLD